jgi:hypothetical protein
MQGYGKNEGSHFNLTPGAADFCLAERLLQFRVAPKQFGPLLHGRDVRHDLHPSTALRPLCTSTPSVLASLGSQPVPRDTCKHVGSRLHQLLPTIPARTTKRTTSKLYSRRGPDPVDCHLLLLRTASERRKPPGERGDIQKVAADVSGSALMGKYCTVRARTVC